MQTITGLFPFLDVVAVAAVEHGVDDSRVEVVLVLRKPPTFVVDDAHAGKEQGIHRERLEPRVLVEMGDEALSERLPLAARTQLRAMLIDLSGDQWDQFGRRVSEDISGGHYEQHLRAAGLEPAA